jgi:hypothetical protein
MCAGDDEEELESTEIVAPNKENAGMDETLKTEIRKLALGYSLEYKLILT